MARKVNIEESFKGTRVAFAVIGSRPAHRPFLSVEIFEGRDGPRLSATMGHAGRLRSLANRILRALDEETKG